MKNLIYLILFLFVFSFTAFSLEITDDLFIEIEDEENLGNIEELDQEEIQDIKRTYKKETVVIKRELSSLDIAVEEVDREDAIVNSNFELKKDESENRGPSSQDRKTSYSLDYGEYEVHWSKK